MQKTIPHSMLLIIVVPVLIFSQQWVPDSTQIADFERFNQDHGYKVLWGKRTCTPEVIFGAMAHRQYIPPGYEEQSALDAAQGFLALNHKIFKMPENLSDLTVSRQRELKGVVHIKFRQFFHDLPVIGATYLCPCG